MSVLTLTLALQKGPPDHHLLRSVTFSLEGPTNERTTATRGRATERRRREHSFTFIGSLESNAALSANKHRRQLLL